MNIKFIAFLLLLISLNCTAQKMEVGITQGIALPVNNAVGEKDSWLNYKKAQNSLSFPTNLFFRYKLKEMNKTVVSVGSEIGFVRQNYSQMLISEEFGYNVNSIEFGENALKLSLHLDLGRKIAENVELGIKYNIGYNISMSSERISFGEGQAVFGSLDYTYDVHLNPENNLYHQLALYNIINLKKNWKLYSSFGYEFGNLSKYDFANTQVQRQTDIDTGMTTSTNYSFEDTDNQLKSRMFQFKIGLLRSF